MKCFCSNILLLVLTFICSAQNQTVGLFQNDNGVFDGYTLFAPNASTTTYLIDNCGHLVHQWESTRLPGLSFYLQENGDLIRAAAADNNFNFNIGGWGGVIEKFNWEGELIWEYEYAWAGGILHHDFKVLPNGNIIAIAWENKSNQEAVDAGVDPFNLFFQPVFPLHIIEINPQEIGGEIVWEWKLWDHIIQDYDATKSNYGNIEEHPNKININNFGYGFLGGSDILHANAIDYNETLDQIIVSSRNNSEIFIIDHNTTTEEAAGEAGDLIWRWGNPQVYNSGNENDRTLFRQHDVHWIKDGLNQAGKIMVFNNGLERPGGDRSTVDIIQPEVDANGNYFINSQTNRFGPEIYDWTYEINSDWHSDYESNGQMLPNGNLFICLGVRGQLLETNETQQLIWNYVSPVGDGQILMQGQNLDQANLPNSTENYMFRAYKYPYNFSAFTGKELVSLGPIELNANEDQLNCMYVEPMPVFVNSVSNNDFQFYPNPTNNCLKIESKTNITTLSIYNIMGANVIVINRPDDLIDISKLKSGIYYITINNQIEKYKFIKL